MFTITPQRVLTVACLLLSGCGLLAPVVGPVYETTTSTVDQAKDEGYIQFTNTTSDHRILLDGKPVGSGADYPPGKVLAVPPGPHLVEITRGGATVLHQKVFIGAGSTRAIELK